MDIKKIAIECGLVSKADVEKFHDNHRFFEVTEAFAQAVIAQWLSEQEVVCNVGTDLIFNKPATYWQRMPTSGTQLIAIPQGENV